MAWAFSHPVLWFAVAMVSLVAPRPTFAQATVKMTAEPQEIWSDFGGHTGFKTSGALLDANNAFHERLFATCMASVVGSTSFTCQKLVMTGIRPSATFPQRVNGNYMYFMVNAYWLYEGRTGPNNPFSYTRDANDYYAILRNLICPDVHRMDAQSTSLGPNETRMVCVKNHAPPLQCDTCVRGKPAGTGSPGTVGNPLTVAGSNKVDRHTDYVSAKGLLDLTREFRGQATGWKFPGANVMVDLFSPSAGSYAVSQTYIGRTYSELTSETVPFEYTLDFPLIRTTENGEVLRINGDGSGTPYPASTDGSFPIGIDGDRLVRVAPIAADGTAWRWVRANNVVEELGVDGRPRHIYLPNGELLTYTYGNGLLTSISDTWGRQLVPVYGPNDRLDAYLLPDGTAIRYGYSGQLLTRVTHADGRERGFVYKEPAYYAVIGLGAPLTGLIDENGKRVATYRYNSSGQAISTEGANGVNRYAVGNWGTYSSITPPIGGDHLIFYGFQNGSLAVTSHNIPAGSGSSASSLSYTYDSVGNITRVSNYTGQVSCHGYDLSRNIETVRVEGLSASASCSVLLGANVVLPAGGRKISSEWHPDWRLATRNAEPGRIVTSVYNGQPDPFSGNALASCAPPGALLPNGKPIAVLCKLVEQATIDANGAAGFNATLQTGLAVRVTTWTYNQWGQVLTENGPRTDVNDVTTYTYYSDTSFVGEGAAAEGHFMGDLQTVINAAGRMTQYTKYNKHGQVLESVDPNGVVTQNSYDLRQRLLSTTTAGQTTSYQYDPAGQLKRVTLPDQSWVGYDYDDAHRQVAVYDQLGNRIEYVLDNAGNRTSENTKDPSGALKRQLARSIDALGRVQQTIGRE